MLTALPKKVIHQALDNTEMHAVEGKRLMQITKSI